MSEHTNIQWADSTGSPWFGCTEVSPGCARCYARQLAETRLAPIIRGAYRKAGFDDWETRPVWGPKATRVRTKGFWNDAIAWNALTGKRTRMFPSLDDWLDEMPAGIIDQDGKKLEPIAVLADFLKLIHDTPNLDWLILTKRPEKWSERIEAAQDWHFDHGDRNVAGWLSDWRKHGIAPKNVWIGVSVENQACADERIPQLLRIPAKIRFLSAEPLLGPVDLKLGEWNYKAMRDGPQTNPHIGWVICGGESGREARPCAVEWIDSVRQQCGAAGVKFFCKQLGSVPITENANLFDWPDSVSVELCKPNVEGFDFAYIGLKDKKGGAMNEWPEKLRVQQFPKSQ